MEKVEKENEKLIFNSNISRIILGLTEIGNLEIEDFRINLSISRNITSLSDVEKVLIKTHQTLLKKYVEKDEKGNLMSANGVYIFKTEDDKTEYQKSFEELNEQVLSEDVKLYKIKTSDLEKIKGVKGITMAKISELIIDDTTI